MIYIATHKKFNVPNLNGYCALQVGAEGKEKYGYLRDNKGKSFYQRKCSKKHESGGTAP